jgi:hypothetical protein
MKELKGGAILVDAGNEPRYRDDPFLPIIDMILSGSSSVNNLSYTSYSGFLFELNVSADDSKYRNFKFMGGKITDFILKLCIITDDGRPISPDKLFKKKPKTTETQLSLLSEAQIQQKIWLDSLLANKKEFTPSIINLAFLDNDNSQVLFECLNSKAIYDPDVFVNQNNDILTYLIDLLKTTRDFSLGVLVMPKISNSVQLASLIHNNDEHLNDALSNTISSLVRLYLECKIIHLDLHKKNILIQNGTYESFIIDFGRICDLNNLDSYTYLTADEKYRCKKFHSDILDIFYGSRGEVKTDENKIDFMRHVCTYLGQMDHLINHRIFTRMPEQRFQLMWLETVYSNSANNEILLDAYNILERSMMVSDVGLTSKTIDRYKSSGMIIDLGMKPKEYTFIFPGNISEMMIVAPRHLTSSSQSPPPYIPQHFSLSVSASQDTSLTDGQNSSSNIQNPQDIPLAIQDPRNPSLSSNDTRDSILTIEDPSSNQNAGNNRKSRKHRKSKKYKKYRKSRRSKKSIK